MKTPRPSSIALLLASLIALSGMAAAGHGTPTYYNHATDSSCSQRLAYGHEASVSCTFPCKAGDRLYIDGRVDSMTLEYPGLEGTLTCGTTTVDCEVTNEAGYWTSCYGENQPPVSLTGSPTLTGTCVVATTSAAYESLSVICGSLGRVCTPSPCRPPIVILPPDIEDILDDIIQW